MSLSEYTRAVLLSSTVMPTVRNGALYKHRTQSHRNGAHMRSPRCPSTVGTNAE